MSSVRLLALRCIGAYLRHAPEHPGRWRLIEPAVSLAPALRSVRKPRALRVREGFLMEVDGSSQTGRMLYATGEYEGATTRVMKRLLKRGQTMVDVGANIGYFTLVASRAVGPDGRVVAFEPAAVVREQLHRNLGLNAVANAVVRDEALSAAPGTVEFFSGPEDDTGLASLRVLPKSTRTTVIQARFDDVWEPEAPVALIKMDIEGAEMAALEGMARCLSRFSPDLIVEVTDGYLRALGASAAALVGFLIERGYSMYRIDHDRLVPVTSAAALEGSPPQFNALFTKRHDWQDACTAVDDPTSSMEQRR
jgi:FkbM family methyltransferase